MKNQLILSIIKHLTMIIRNLQQVKYVLLQQDLMTTVTQNTVIYICGGVSMGAEVTERLSKHLSHDVIKKMESDNRLIKELWG